MNPRYTAEEQDAARNLFAKLTLLGRAPLNAPPTQKVLAPGRAMVTWKEDILPGPESSNVWPKLREEVSQRAEFLAQIREAAKEPVGGLNLDFTQGWNLVLNHISPSRSGVWWLDEACVLELHDGHPAEAWENLIASVRLLHVCEREPAMISQMVRVAMSQTAANVSWEALQYPGWRDEQLDELRSAWSSVDVLTGLRACLEMERALLPATYEPARQDYTNVSFITAANSQPSIDLGEILADTKASYEKFADRYPRYWAWKNHWSYDEELFNTETLQAALETARGLQTNRVFTPALHALGTTFSNIQTQFADASPRFLLARDDEFARRMLIKAAYIEMQRQMLLTAIALRRSQMANGKYPDDLKELVPKFLAAPPLDPMDGKPLRYQNKSESFVLYSVGEDGVDDGGDPIPAQSSPGGNIQWFAGRDAVWPTPATPEEVEAYKQKMLAGKFTPSGRPMPMRGAMPKPANTN